MSVSKKIVLLGHFGVGKSSLLRRFVENTFSENYTVTIGVHIMKKEVLVGDEAITLIIWDVEGTDDFSKYRSSYLLGTSAFIYVFDATRAITYSDLRYNLNHLEERFSGIPIHVVGNKVDLVDKKELLKNLETQEIKHSYLSSAKTGENVELLFQDIAAQLLKNAK